MVLALSVLFNAVGHQKIYMPWRPVLLPTAHRWPVSTGHSTRRGI